MRYVICSGGQLGDWALAELREGDVLVGADRGALFLVDRGFSPDMALGDFDSVSAGELMRIRTGSRRFEACDPIAKDWTDTEMALRWVLAQQDPKPDEVVLIGVLGSRWDHSLANIHLLRVLLEAGVRGRIVDETNELHLVDGSKPLTLARTRHTYVSLLPLSLEVTGITLNGFQYPLLDATLTIGQSLGISNVLLEQTGTIRLRDGLLLAIQSMDYP